jgi:hypothetical protein
MLGAKYIRSVTGASKPIHVSMKRWKESRTKSSGWAWIQDKASFIFSSI